MVSIPEYCNIASLTGILPVLRLDEGKDGSMVVVLESRTEVAAVSFMVRYDAALGKPMVSLGDLPDGAVLTVNDTVEGELTILIDSAEPFGSVGKTIGLIEIVFASAAVNGLVVFEGEASLADGFGNIVPVVLKALQPTSY